VELLGAPQGEAAILLARDVGLVAKLLPESGRKDEAALGVERVLKLAEERHSCFRHFTPPLPSMARQTPPCCATSHHPTPPPTTTSTHGPCLRFAETVHGHGGPYLRSAEGVHGHAGRAPGLRSAEGVHGHAGRAPGL